VHAFFGTRGAHANVLLQNKSSLHSSRKHEQTTLKQTTHESIEHYSKKTPNIQIHTMNYDPTWVIKQIFSGALIEQGCGDVLEVPLAT